jgi:hypothetical protein
MSTAALAAKTYKSYEVKFQAFANQGELRAQSVGNGCLKGKGDENDKMGCIRFSVDDFGLITFYLGNKDKPKTCDTNAQWVISKVELSDEGYLVDDSGTAVVSNKGIFDGDLPDWLAEAFPQVNKTTGVLYEAKPAKDGVSRVVALNLNNNAKTDPKDIWYQVTVAECKDDSDVVLISDPRFENEGSN